MNKILITGGLSPLARGLISLRDKDNYILNPSHDELDILNLEHLKSYLDFGNFQNIIHTAWAGSSYQANTETTCLNNIKMLSNLIKCRDKYKRLFVFGSGIEKQASIPFHLEKYYDSKIACSLLAQEQDNIIKLNLYNVFSAEEDSRRFISTCISNCLQNKDIIISENKYFDFFYISDLIKVIQHYIENPPNKYISLDCVYGPKIKLDSVALYIKELTNSTNSIIIESESSNDYIGDGERLHKLGIRFQGLFAGIEETVNTIKENE